MPERREREAEHIPTDEVGGGGGGSSVIEGREAFKGDG